MERLNFSHLNISRGIKAPAHRWQELTLKAIQEFDINPRGKGMIWGRIATWKIYQATDNQICQFIERCYNDTKELASQDRGRYFVKLIYSKK